MLISVLIILGLFHHQTVLSNIITGDDEAKQLGIRFKQAIQDALEKIDKIAATCPPKSFFYNGSCYFYLPSIQFDSLKGVRSNDVTIDEAADHCHTIRAKLWDIETIVEFSFVLNRIYAETQSYDSPRIAVNFTLGKRLLNLRKKLGKQQYLTINNINDYSLSYKPLADLPARNTCIVIDISKGTRRVSLEEKFRPERRSDHYVCKMKINSCYNNTRCGQHGRCINLKLKYKCICSFMYKGEHCDTLSSGGIQSIVGIVFICIASLILLSLPIFHFIRPLKDKRNKTLI